jgi:hypothetical protein
MARDMLGDKVRDACLELNASDERLIIYYLILFKIFVLKISGGLMSSGIA